MYLGRVIGVGQTHDEHYSLFFRLSSQSCPGREIVGDVFGEMKVVDKEQHKGSGNSTDRFLNYPCYFRIPDYVVIGNGDHTRSIVQLILGDKAPAQALAMVLADLGPEDDGKKTPRIAGVIHSSAKNVWIGIVGEHGLVVETQRPRVGGWFTTATEFRDQQFVAESFQTINYEQLEEFARGKDQETMATIVVTQSKKGNGFEVEVNNF